MITFLENRVIPVLIRVGENKILVAVRNGIALTLPLPLPAACF